LPEKPTLTVVAGPSGSGKSVRFSVRDVGVDAFNVDDRCRNLYGSYQGIPPVVRAQAQMECERFVEEHIRDGVSFATETTLRTTVAIDQATRAKAAGFSTSIIYIGTGNVEINVERVRLRGLAGGHSAPPEGIRDNYTQSLRNLPAALVAFDRADVYDNSGAEPRLVLEIRDGHVKAIHSPLPTWIHEALDGTHLAAELDREAN
jgi:predicted ABC-type ATPase